MNKQPKAFHPILFAMFPVIFLYSHNIGEVFLSQTVAPIAVCLASGILLWCLIFAVLRNNLKSAMSIGNIAIFHFTSITRIQGVELSQQADGEKYADSGKLENKPDIYYIILDEHTRADKYLQVYI